jgi:hypothetical protein
MRTVGDIHVAAHRTKAAERCATINAGIASNRCSRVGAVTDQQRAALDGRRTGIGVDAVKNLLTSSNNQTSAARDHTAERTVGVGQ